MAPTSPIPSPRTMSPPPNGKPKRYHSQFRPHTELKIPGAASQTGSGAGGAYPPSNKLNLSAPRPIRRPRQILYLLGIFVLLYWFGLRHGLGEERAWKPLGYYMIGRHRKSSLTIDGRFGMATLKADGKEHPIYELMERGEEHWHRLVESQSKSLFEGVREYKRRYGMPPPVGFDKWWAFCDAHNITIRDEYDHVMKDVLIHHALEPAEWRKRALSLDGEEMSYTMRVSKRDGVKLTGERAEMPRPISMAGLVSGFLEDLPDGFMTQITISDHDTAGQIVGQDQRQMAMGLLRKGEHFSRAELSSLQSDDRNAFFGWFSACDANSPANTRPGGENTTHSGDGMCPSSSKLKADKSFIADHIPTMDFCDFPELKKLHGVMATDYEGRSESIIRPMMALSKFPGDASFLMTPTEGYWNLTEQELSHEGFWEEKTDSRLFWRGSSTGGFDTLYRDWRDSHRIRMHVLANGKKGPGEHARWAEEEKEVLMPDGQGGYVSRTRRAGLLSEAYADIKLSGKAVQCNPELCAEIEKEIAFAPRMEPSESLKYRYALDIDGNGWSSRFHRLLSGASPVIKMTMFPEWHQGWLVPWYHYIPLKPDYSDLYDIMAFFAGPIDENGKLDESLGHDQAWQRIVGGDGMLNKQHLARKIGEAGQQFALNQWNWRNMQAYTFRMLLEIQRLYASDRRIASFRLSHD